MLNSVAENQFKKAQFNFPPNFLSSTLEESSGPVFQNVCLCVCVCVCVCVTNFQASDWSSYWLLTVVLAFYLSD